MKNKKIKFSSTIGQLIAIVGFLLSVIGITVAATITVTSYTNGTAAKINALDRKINSKMDSVHVEIGKISSDFKSILGYFEEKEDLYKYLTSSENAKKSIKDTIICPEQKTRIASRDCVTSDNVDMEDNYVHAIEKDQ